MSSYDRSPFHAGVASAEAVLFTGNRRIRKQGAFFDVRYLQAPKRAFLAFEGHAGRGFLFRTQYRVASQAQTPVPNSGGCHKPSNQDTHNSQANYVFHVSPILPSV